MSITSEDSPRSAARTADHPPATTTAGPASDRSRQGLWTLLIRLHFYAGVFVAPFLVVAALTGLTYAFTPQLDRIAYGDQLRVERVTGTARPLADQIRAARATHLEGSIASVITPTRPDATTQVVLSVPDLGEKQRTVYVDPYSGKVTGALTTWSGSTPLTTWIDQLHRDLHLGTVGLLYSELAASWLWVIAGGGVLLWLGRRRHYRGGKPTRAALLPDLTAGRGVRRTRGWHASTGLWLALGLFFLSATGLTWSDHAGARFDAALDVANVRSPELDTALPDAATPSGQGGQGGQGGGHHGASGTATGTGDPAADAGRVLAGARAGGLTGPVEITPPENAHSAWTVAQTDNFWPVHRDKAALDPGTGDITARTAWADYPLLAKLSSLGIQAHMGVLFGLANQLLLAATALGLLTVIFWGYRMWWQRRPTRADRRGPFGKPPARGTWRQIPMPVLLLGIPVTVALGWALPLLGITLAGFLAADATLGFLHRLRRPTS